MRLSYLRRGLNRLSALAAFLLLLTCGCDNRYIYVESNFMCETDTSFSVSYRQPEGGAFKNAEPAQENGHYYIGGKQADIQGAIGLQIERPSEFFGGELAFNQPCAAAQSVVNVVPAEAGAKPSGVSAGVLDSRKRFVISLRGAAPGGARCRCVEGSQISGKFLPEEEDPQEIVEGLIELIYEGSCVSSEIPSGYIVKITSPFACKRSGEYDPLYRPTPLCGRIY